MGNGICRIFDRSHRHFGMRDHARMIAARNVVDFRLRTRGEFLLNVGWYDFIGLAYDVPRRDRLPTDCSRRFIRQAARGERSLRNSQACRNLRRFVPVTIRPFDPHTLRPDVVVHLNGRDSVTEEWTVQNYTLEIHDFHMHQIHFRDVTNGDDNRTPVLDTVNVPPAVRGASTEPGVDVPTTPGFVRLRMKFTRASIGEFVFHCHILSHEDKGMMQKVRVVAD
jgi:hypothetical protein